MLKKTSLLVMLALESSATEFSCLVGTLMVNVTLEGLWFSLPIELPSP